MDKKKKTVSGIILLSGILASVSPLSAAIPLVVIPDEPTAVEKSAAAELAGELGKCLGCRPIVICERVSRKGPMLYVGATKASKAVRGNRKWDTDGVFLKSVAGGVVLDGEPTRAPIYAVDIYLERYCGVRWWTSDSAYYPKFNGVPIDGIHLEYAPRGLAEKSGVKWTRPQTREEAVENWIREVKSLGVRAVRETTDSDNINRCFEKLRKGGMSHDR